LVVSVNASALSVADLPSGVYIARSGSATLKFAK
jgi:hypothetical protein